MKSAIAILIGIFAAVALAEEPVPAKEARKPSPARQPIELICESKNEKAIESAFQCDSLFPELVANKACQNKTSQRHVFRCDAENGVTSGSTMCENRNWEAVGKCIRATLEKLRNEAAAPIPAPPAKRKRQTNDATTILSNLDAYWKCILAIMESLKDQAK